MSTDMFMDAIDKAAFLAPVRSYLLFSLHMSPGTKVALEQTNPNDKDNRD